MIKQRESMGRAHSKAAIIGRAGADPLFIVHLADKQRIEANTRDRRGVAGGGSYRAEGGGGTDTSRRGNKGAAGNSERDCNRERGGESEKKKGQADHGYCHVTKSWCIVNAMHV